jgi:alpha-L-rhamnosidase
MNSFNHYSLGSVGEWLVRFVAGIDQTSESVGYEQLRIAPQIGGSLTRVAASYETPRGLVATEWSIDGDHVEVAAHVPPGTTARVSLPSVDVLESAGSLEETAGISDVAVGDGLTEFTIVSGGYRFRFRRSAG